MALKASSIDAFKPFLLHDKVLELSATTAPSVVLLTELAQGLVCSLAVKLQEFTDSLLKRTVHPECQAPLPGH